MSFPTARSGVVYVGSEDNHVYALDASTGEKIWQYKTGGSAASPPAVVDGVVYVGSGDSYMYALDASTGEELWRYKTGGRLLSSPMVVGGVVYVGSLDGYLYALEAVVKGFDANWLASAPTPGKPGTLLWRYQADVTTETPIVVDGVVYFGSRFGGEQMNEEHVNAVDAKTGELLWGFQTADWVYGTPAVVNGVVYVGVEDNYLYALDASDGNLIWRYHQGNGQESSPVVVDGVVYVSPDYGYLYALDVSTGQLIWRYEGDDSMSMRLDVSDGLIYVGGDSGLQAWDASTGKLVRRYAPGLDGWVMTHVDGVIYTESESGTAVVAIDAENGEIHWRYEAAAGFYVPVVANGILYLSTFGPHLYALETATGRLLWQYEIDGRVASSPGVADGVVYVGSEPTVESPDEHHLYALEASTGKLLWRYEADDEIDTSPVISDGLVYFGTDGYLYALRVSTNN